MEKISVSTNKAPGAIGPYSQALKLNNIVYTSGQIPLDSETGETVGADVATQTKKVMENLQHVLEAAGASFKTVVKSTVFLKDMTKFGEFNDVYAAFFQEPFPARSCVEVAALPKGVLVEVEVVAYVEEDL